MESVLSEFVGVDVPSELAADQLVQRAVPVAVPVFREAVLFVPPFHREGGQDFDEGGDEHHCPDHLPHFWRVLERAILHKHLPWHEDDDLVSVEVVPQGFVGVVRIEQDGEDRGRHRKRLARGVGHERALPSFGEHGAAVDGERLAFVVGVERFVRVGGDVLGGHDERACGNDSREFCRRNLDDRLFPFGCRVADGQGDVERAAVDCHGRLDVDDDLRRLFDADEASESVVLQRGGEFQRDLVRLLHDLERDVEFAVLVVVAVGRENGIGVALVGDVHSKHSTSRER